MTTVQEKIQAIRESGWPIAFDGCHKIYFLQDADREAQAREFGYVIMEAELVAELYESSSCGLRFIERWGFNNDDFDHPLNIRQFEEED